MSSEKVGSKDGPLDIGDHVHAGEGSPLKSQDHLKSVVGADASAIGSSECGCSCVQSVSLGDSVEGRHGDKSGLKGSHFLDEQGPFPVLLVEVHGLEL